MFWYLLMVICVLLVFIGVFAIYKFEDEIGCAIIGLAGTVFLLLIICVPIVNVNNKKAIAVFGQQKEYIESHVPESEIENASITNKKIELNEWLFNAQYSKQNHRIFSLYPDEILQLEPIE